MAYVSQKISPFIATWVLMFVVFLITIGTFGGWLDTLHYWQDFFGALIAASVAIVIFALTEWVKARSEHRDHLYLLHRSVGAALSNLAEIDMTMSNFAEKKLVEMLDHIDSDIENSRPSVGQAFIPLMHVVEISEELLRKTSGSGYVDILTIELVNRSKDLRKIIDDINRQFDRTLASNSQIVFSGLNKTLTANNSNFRQNVEKFRTQVVGEDFRSNVRHYALLLIRSQIAVGKLQEWGVRKWKYVFRNVRPEYVVEEINSYFDEELKNRIAMYGSGFKTDLSSN